MKHFTSLKKLPFQVSKIANFTSLKITHFPSFRMTHYTIKKKKTIY